jgi:hypothetical protein
VTSRLGEGDLVADLLFVLLTIAVFAVLAVVARGVERL